MIRGEDSACLPLGRATLDPVTYVSEASSKYGICLLFVMQIFYFFLNANVYHNFD